MPIIQATGAQVFKSSIAVAAASFLWVPALPEHLPLVALSGLAGGVSRWIAAKEKLWPQGLSSVILGVLAAVWLWPVGEPLLAPLLGKIEMEPTTSIMFGGYVTGLMGLTLITFIIDFTSKATKGGDDEAGS